MDDLTCQRVVEMVTAYLEGGLDDLTRSRFENHLTGCLGCREYLAQIRRTVSELSRLPDRQLPVNARQELLAALRAGTGRSDGA